MNNLTRSLSSKFVRLMLLLMLIFVVSDYIEARPGGGSSSRSRSSGGSKSSSRSSSSKSSSRSSSGGGSSYSGGGGSGAGLPTPVVVIFVIFAAVAFGFVLFSDSRKYSNTSTSNSVRPDDEENHLRKMQAAAQRKIGNFKKNDPNFSETLLLDYVQNVFHQYYSALGTAKIGNLKPFFLHSPNTNDVHQYTEIVINALYVIGLDTVEIGYNSYDRIKVMLETNFTQTHPTTNRRLRYLSEQEWTFVRAKNVQSLPPAKMQALACPSCGAPESFHDDTKCGACGTIIEPATMQWAVQSQTNIFDETYHTNALVSYEEEMGTTDATVYAKNLPQMQSEFEQLHSIGSAQDYFQDFSNNVVRPAFMAIYAAWTAKDLAPVRHLISDFLFQTQDFWIQEYKSQGLTNHLDDIKISNTLLAKIDIDKFYESFTVRIFANCKDYTTKDSNNALVGGNKNSTRAFSEYWTFVRRIGTEQQPKDSLQLDSCPSCSAPLDKMGMTGICGYCSHKVSSGDYSWVLSRITQDEAYN